MIKLSIIDRSQYVQLAAGGRAIKIAYIRRLIGKDKIRLVGPNKYDGFKHFNLLKAFKLHSVDFLNRSYREINFGQFKNVSYILVINVVIYLFDSLEFFFANIDFCLKLHNLQI